jgi:hypothetical protein
MFVEELWCQIDAVHMGWKATEMFEGQYILE